MPLLTVEPIHWLDAHSGAVSAIATVFLVVITGCYVIFTYMLVKEQRLQMQFPELARYWANEASDNADIRLHNAGSGTAVETLFALGPTEGVAVYAPDLGKQRTLRPGEDLTWRIRPVEGAAQFVPGDLPLTLSCLNHNRSKVFCEVIVIRFERHGDKIAIRDLGSLASEWTKRELRRLTRKALPWSRKPTFQWHTRKTNIPALLLDDKVRDALRAELARAKEKFLPAWSKQAEIFRERF